MKRCSPLYRILSGSLTVYCPVTLDDIYLLKVFLYRISDGTMGSNCNESVPCTEAGTGCNLDLNKCTACGNDGYHIVDSVCRLGMTYIACV